MAEASKQFWIANMSKETWKAFLTSTMDPLENKCFHKYTNVFFPIVVKQKSVNKALKVYSDL